ncbi:VOC family protein [Anaerocolumna xylanovorans]|uniref:Glyoxalase-like domain-containing protein n=1 Tax=Anaerocolumna xylanovorans DSM 12503 TaxID=1121345 RepID=A0A1M7YN68_9FIRM|nr:VOC family protein [Anaerocolumna xylanovorans]SHO53978.1 Glyoxalase-like domain-containing protein [Anaerocolumna xylanovorans DSM 12503]
MKVSHIIYKVSDLEEAVREFKDRGFEVEMGSKKNPYNAIIYFSEGPYLELLASSGMPKFFKSLLRCFGKGRFADRLDYWDTHKGGPCAVALENYRKDLNEESAVLKRNNQGYFQMNSRRNDTKGRKLRFTCLFPDEMQIPFFMTYFNIDPKPKNFVHANGVKRIKNISFGTREQFIPIIDELCDDNTLTVFTGDGVKDLEFEYTAGMEGHKVDLR